MSGVKMWSPSGEDCHIGLTSGHTFVVPADREGVEVPSRFRKDALAKGCLPVGMEPEKEEATTFDRGATIMAKMREMLNSDGEGLFTGDGKPNLQKLSGLCGFAVERAERDKYWAEVEKDPDGDED